ncbi:MAG: F0F1 ATP synthase subunit delta [Deltaproteobacteria bacterium]
MLIDWFTVIAQVVNFLILVALLKYFLYDRVVQAMKQREEKIASRLDEADSKKKQAHEEAREYERKRRELEEQADQMIAEAKQEAEAKREELLAEVRRETEEVKTRWHDAFAREIAELADAELQDRMLKAFVQRLEKLDEEQLSLLRNALVNREKTVRVQSAVELSSERRQTIRKALEKQIGRNLDISFEESPHLALGLELDLEDHKIGWNVESYLDRVEQNLNRIIDAEAASHSPSHGGQATDAS